MTVISLQPLKVAYRTLTGNSMQKLRVLFFAVPELLPGAVLLLCPLSDYRSKACPLPGSAEVQADDKREKSTLQSGTEKKAEKYRLKGKKHG